MSSITVIFFFFMFGFLLGAPHDGGSTSIEVTELNSLPLSTGRVRYYVILYHQAKWITALHYCRLHGMQLASINSEKESDKLKEAIKSSKVKNFWTSGADFAEKDGNYFWMSTGRPFNYVNWGGHQPNNWHGNEHCVEISQWDEDTVSWNDRYCSDEINFICEVRERAY